MAEDPYLIWEEDFDRMEKRIDRRVRRSYLSQDLSRADQKLKHVYEQQKITTPSSCVASTSLFTIGTER